jgi:hypothetical protein
MGMGLEVTVKKSAISNATPRIRKNFLTVLP